MNKLQFVPAECKIIRYEAADVINTSTRPQIATVLEEDSWEYTDFNTLH